MNLKAKVLYDDKNVKIRESGVTIKSYYFPFCVSKRIPLTEIKDVQHIHHDLNVKWGLNEYDTWLALDSHRP